MDSDELRYVESATSVLRWRWYWFLGTLTCGVSTLHFGGVAPSAFLAASLACGAAWFVSLLLIWRYRSFLLSLVSTLFAIWGSRGVADRFAVHQPALFWQGFLLWLSFAALLVALLAPFIRRFCRLPSPAA